MKIVDLATHPETFVTVNELAAYWRVRERTIQYWIAKRSLPAERAGRSLRIRPKDALNHGCLAEPIATPLAGGRQV